MERFACFQLCLAYVVLNTTLAGCGIGTFVPIRTGKSTRLTASLTRRKHFVSTRQGQGAREAAEQVEQKKSLYNNALNAYREIVKANPTGKYAQRSLWQMSEIYKRRYQWDKIIESYEAILAVSPSGYYADRAKSAIADIRKRIVC